MADPKQQRSGPRRKAVGRNRITRAPGRNIRGAPLAPNPGAAIGVLGAVLRRLTTTSVPRSAAPVSPIERISGEAARTVSGYNPLRPKVTPKQMGPGRLSRKTGDSFVRTVKLDPSQVKDWRRPRVDPKQTAVERGAVGTAGNPPRPNPRAIERANSNARFKRSGLRPTAR